MTVAARTGRINLIIVSPALASANHGNWQTAKRYADLLSHVGRVRVQQSWDGDDTDDMMIALHARRSHASISDWYKRRGSSGLIAALTGTDLYRDIDQDAQAKQSLLMAQALIVLQSEGLAALPVALHDKAHVLFQSTTSRATLPKTSLRLRALMVGHLRAEKSPETFFEAAILLQDRKDILLRHIGGEHDPELARQAHNTESRCLTYRFLGACLHNETRRHIQRAHVLVHASVMEGGAHVIMEAVCSGVPVLASKVAGNVGMLGQDYEGYFARGDAKALASLLLRCRHEPAFLETLQSQCALRAPLFDPAAERRDLTTIVQSLYRSIANY